ncbi:hypothetical protein EX30DRAFT_362821 [Ascodesmis nigricans]|uniref:Cysteine protease n=1 Tax=Ascodesmis nigricans TaxID=341454 RepID=A0A4S2N2D5_9PEZI|nr:hypothetical protein EX30DRAFT_362821 [Ascodesmis nigricans]
MSNPLFSNIQSLVSRYIWDPEPRNTDPTQPIWVLGRKYPPTIGSPRSSASASSPPSLHDTTSTLASMITDPVDLSASDSAVQVDASQIPTAQALKDETPNGWPQDFLDDFGSKPWITYRSDFTAIPRAEEAKDEQRESKMTLLTTFRSHLPENASGFTSDVGWGCMIRSGQSVLVNTLFALHLGRDWRRGQNPKRERELLALFADDPRAPFSIHNFAKYGHISCGVRPGEWFGPSAAARCIKELTEMNPETNLRVYVTTDGGDVYEDSFFNVAKEGDTFHPTLLLIPIRLGIRGVTPVYWEALKATIQLPSSVGIAGGRPSASHYFLGVQSSRFFYHDPHVCRPRFPFKEDPVKDYTADEIESCYTRRLRTLDIRDMDPSMLLAFLIHDLEEWNYWKEHIEKVQGKSVVHVSDKEPILVSQGEGGERAEAVDEVEAFDTEDEDEHSDPVKIERDEDDADEEEEEEEGGGVKLKGVKVVEAVDDDDEELTRSNELGQPKEKNLAVEVR